MVSQQKIRDSWNKKVRRMRAENNNTPRNNYMLVKHLIKEGKYDQVGGIVDTRLGINIDKVVRVWKWEEEKTICPCCGARTASTGHIVPRHKPETEIANIPVHQIVRKREIFIDMDYEDENFEIAYARLFKWLDEHGYKPVPVCPEKARK